MKTSETLKELSSALLEAQKSISFVVKAEDNPFYKSSYADLNAVIDAVKPALNNNGLIFIQTASTCNNGCAVTTRLMHTSGEFIEDTATCPLAKNDPQGYGSAVTYLRRYSLVSIIGLPQVDDDGNEGSGLTQDKKSNPAAPSFKPIVITDLEMDPRAVFYKQIKEIVDQNFMSPADVFTVLGTSVKDIMHDEKLLSDALNKLRVSTQLGAKTL